MAAIPGSSAAWMATATFLKNTGLTAELLLSP